MSMRVGAKWSGKGANDELRNANLTGEDVWLWSFSRITQSTVSADNCSILSLMKQIRAEAETTSQTCT